MNERDKPKTGDQPETEFHGLILIRSVEQAFVIDYESENRVTVKVIGADQGRAKLLITAPSSRLILRKELVESSPDHQKSERIKKGGNLILTRKRNKVFVIDPYSPYPVEVTVYGIERNVVKLGIKADRDKHPV